MSAGTDSLQYTHIVTTFSQSISQSPTFDPHPHPSSSISLKNSTLLFPLPTQKGWSKRTWKNPHSNDEQPHHEIPILEKTDENCRTVIAFLPLEYNTSVVGTRTTSLNLTNVVQSILQHSIEHDLELARNHVNIEFPSTHDAELLEAVLWTLVSRTGAQKAVGVYKGFIGVRRKDNHDDGVLIYLESNGLVEFARSIAVLEDIVRTTKTTEFTFPDSHSPERTTTISSSSSSSTPSLPELTFNRLSFTDILLTASSSSSSTTSPKPLLFATTSHPSTLEGAYLGSALGTSRPHPQTSNLYNPYVYLSLTLTHSGDVWEGIPTAGKLSTFSGKSDNDNNLGRHGRYIVEDDGDTLIITWDDLDSNPDPNQPKTARARIIDDENLIFTPQSFQTISTLKVERAKPLSLSQIPIRYISPTDSSHHITFQSPTTLEVSIPDLAADSAEWNYVLSHYTLSISKEDGDEKREFTVYVPAGGNEIVVDGWKGVKERKRGVV